ncbi:MAG: hypothetical protein ACLQHS_11275, partial [Candidatus Limnocylindrales bacterium]
SSVLSAQAGHSVTLTLTSHDNDYPTQPTFTVYDDVAMSGGAAVRSGVNLVVIVPLLALAWIGRATARGGHPRRRTRAWRAS